MMGKRGMPYNIRLLERLIWHKRVMGARHMRHVKTLRPLRLRMDKSRRGMKLAGICR